MHIAIRLCLPDELGALADVAMALGEAGANIETLHVVDRDGGYAVDDICVELGASPELLREALERVPRVVVEAITAVPDAHDPRTTIDLAADLIDGVAAPEQRLVDGLPDALWASWAMIIDGRGDQPMITTWSAKAPARATFELPWLPLAGARRLEPAAWMPSAWRFQAGGGRFQLAVAPVGDPEVAVLVAREWPARIRPAELRQLQTLARLAAGATDAHPVGVT